MLNGYFEQLKRLSELLSHGKNLDFSLWVETMKLTALILVQSIGFLVGLSLIVTAPVIIYRKLLHHANEKMKLAANQEAAEITYRNWRRTRIAYIVGMIVLYVPFAIPTLLLLL